MIDVHSNGDIDHLHVVYFKLLHIRFLTALTVENVLYSSCSIQFIIPREDDSARTAKMKPILNWILSQMNIIHASSVKLRVRRKRTDWVLNYIIRVALVEVSSTLTWTRQFLFKLKRARIQFHVLAGDPPLAVLTSLQQMLRDLLIVRANHLPGRWIATPKKLKSE